MNGEVEKLASLARVSVPEERTKNFEKEFESVISYIRQLDSLNIHAVSTTSLPVVHNVFRTDGTPTPQGTWTQKIISLFPKRSGNHLSVKKILSHD